MAHLGILTTRSHPTLPYLLDELAASLPGARMTLVFDGKDFSDKDTAIFADRTAGAFPVRETTSLFSRFGQMDVADHNHPRCIETVRELGIELLVNGGTPRRLGRDLLGSCPRGVLNVHPGILPKYRGATCCEWALHFGDPVGVTAHFMDEGLDSGPILFTRELRIRPGMDYQAIRVALYRLALATAAEAVGEIFRRDVIPSRLPRQPEGQPFKPMPDSLLADLKLRLSGASRS